MATRDRRDTQGMTRRPSAAPSTYRDPYGSYGGSWPEPFGQFRRLADQMDRWFDTFGFGRSTGRSAGQSGASWPMNMWAPELETFRRDDQFVVRMDLPGLDKNDVNVEVTDDSIVIHGERQQVNEEDREGYYRTERSYGRFYREVALPEGTQTETAKANYRDGVLEITVKAPARQLHKPRRVEIGTGSTTEGEERQRANAPEQGAPRGSVPVTDRSSSERSVAHERGGKE